jgi:ubiquinone/menaquinone biosynthesis C-methylase UbiE
MHGMPGNNRLSCAELRESIIFCDSSMGDAMKIDEAYEIWSHSYDQDRNLTRDLDEQITRHILKGHSFDSIVELGCGTGKNTRLLTEIGAKVQAIDFSAAMISQARHKAALGNVTFILADLTQRWPVADVSVNLISCNLVLEHVSDLRFVFSEGGRILATGGQIFVSELHPFRQYQGVEARFEWNTETIRIPAYVHHISDFLDAAEGANLSLQRLDEWWHTEDEGKPPRLISFMFRKSE